MTPFLRIYIIFTGISGKWRHCRSVCFSLHVQIHVNALYQSFQMYRQPETLNLTLNLNLNIIRTIGAE